MVHGSDRIPTPRLAEKYKECLTSKEKILKEIEVKKEYLSSLQPRLNSIMQVPEPCRRSHSEGSSWAGLALEMFHSYSGRARGRSETALESPFLFMRQFLQNCSCRSC